MTVEVPKVLEDLLRAEVESGRFPSVDAVVTEAVHRLLREPAAMPATPGVDPGPLGIGKSVDDARKRPGRPSRPDVRRVIEEMKEFARGNTLGEGLTIREMIEDGRR